MLRTSTATAAILALVLGAGSALAQSIADAQPAEFPPASYTGKQYVDSNGCVFVRAGFDGAVTWVPRVNRKRKLLCGMAPTFASRPAPEPPAQVAAAPAVVPPRTAAPKPAAAPPPRRPTQPAATAMAPVRTVEPSARTAKPPVRTVKPAVRTVKPTVRTVKPVVRTVTAPDQAQPPSRTACPNKSPLSQRYLQPSDQPVRCGPQAVSPTIRHDGASHGTGTGRPVVAVAPPPKVAPPPGYKPVWEDDRLNPYRGVRTAAGSHQSALVWTNTLPRRLIGRPTGDEVTTTARVSTKAVPPARATAAPRVAVTPGHRFVQVGTFGVPSNAQNTAARLQQMGLPVRIGSYTKSGKTYRVVLAGPFASPGKLAGGLNAVRRAGFSDAFTRK